MKEIEKILSKTHDGLDVFVHYLGDACLKKTFKNPYRKDSYPSCVLSYRQVSSQSKYYLHDFGSSEWCGDCFHFVAMLHHLDLKNSFKEVLRIIIQDLNISLNMDVELQEHSARTVLPFHQQDAAHHPLQFQAIYMNFLLKDINFFKKYGIKESTLHAYHVKKLRRCKFEREDGTSFEFRSVGLSNKMYGYLFNNGKGIKIYRPDAKVRFIYAGDVPHPYVFGYEQLPKQGEILYITGGEKDVLSLTSHGFNAIALNSESAKMPISLMEDLSKRFHHIIFMYDCDETGKKESNARVQELKQQFSVTRLVLPLAGTKREKDISDYFAAGHTSESLHKLTSEILK